jgi:L-asparaginase II
VPDVPLVRVVRSGLEESVHHGDVAVVDAAGQLVAWAGQADRIHYARSSMKPLQAAVSLSLAPFDFTDREVAVMCASHNAEWVHVETVRTLLARAGVDEEALRCPAMRPWDDATLELDPTRRRLNSDCSGKHAGMLAACRAQGWPMETYRSPDHPLQEAVLEAVLAATGLPSVTVGVDGCGVPVHGLPLQSMALIYAGLAAPDRIGTVPNSPNRQGSLEPFVRRAVSAMRAQPYLVAGRDRVDTAVMETAPGVIVKAGAEGLICAALLDRGMGVAVKIRDGGARAAGPALIHALSRLEVLDEAALDRLAPFVRSPVRGGDERVGELSPEFDLSFA